MVSPTAVKQEEHATGLRLRLGPELRFTDEQFERLCRQNRDLRIEMTAEGDLILMPPTGWMTGDRNAEITMQLRLWAKRDGTGVATDSSTGFTLPNGAKRSPDAAWVLRERLAALTPEQREGFLPLCPDFVVELRSRTDALADLHEKMTEYIRNGARLGWLIDPETQTVYVYRPEAEVVVLERPMALPGDPELPGFVLDLTEIWTPPSSEPSLPAAAPAV
ncbi:MAG: Uma2 family endonuclease [Chloracidobacterium sp.]|nr:Uma2 family endonuclease [Chloracidobacterium sp.]MDW8217332.1 Uma2 family endonuclease [Acidobacteriota bacterium]